MNVKDVKTAAGRFKEMYKNEFLCLNQSNISKIDISSSWEDSFKNTVEKISKAWPGESDKLFCIFVKR